ncbi:MAG: hypothetical protein JXM70_15270 [Pirellulales bacterium]|nr:hypothetical protein [Pirellulales bacterium]
MHVKSINTFMFPTVAGTQTTVCCPVFAMLCVLVVLSSSATAGDAVKDPAYGPEMFYEPPTDPDIVTHKPQPPLAKKPPEPPAKDWIFDQSRYSNSPKTGDRVMQYEQKKPAFRDPNAFYDSPHESYPFSPAPYGPYPRFAPPRYDGSTAYDQYSLPYRPYYPYYPYGAYYYGP